MREAFSFVGDLTALWVSNSLMKKLGKRSRSATGSLLIIALCIGCATPQKIQIRKAGFLDDYSNMEFVIGLRLPGRFEWVDPSKDLSQAQSIAIPDFQHINPVGDSLEEAELHKAEVASAKKVVEGLASRLKSEGIFARVERSESAPADLILRGAVTDFSPERLVAGGFFGGSGRLQVEALLIEVQTGHVVGRVQVKVARGGPVYPWILTGLIRLALAVPRQEHRIITQLTEFLRTKVKRLK